MLTLCHQNWYQNRRAKSKNGMKTTEAQFEVRSDGSNNHWSTFDTSFQDFVNINYFENTNSQHATSIADDMQVPANFFNGDDSINHYNTEDSTLHEQDPVDMAFDGTDFPGLPISLESTLSLGNFKASGPDHGDYDLDSYPTDSVAGIAMPEDLPMEQPFQPMYQIAANGISLGNLSDGTFMSATSSSDGEPSLMTPPEKTSPTPLQPQDPFDRRGSVTGGLSTDLHTFHLQSRQPSQVVYDDSSIANSSRASPSASVRQWASPSPPPTIRQSSTATSLANRIDLAARRKRPRPAPLIKPDAAQRSHSFGGPLTSSPRSRKLLLDPSHPVRRVRSGLDVVSGRIQKPTSTSAQLSPRLFENHFHAGFPSRRSPSAYHTSAYQQAPLTPLSAAQTAECPMEFPIHNVDEGFAQSTNHEESFDMHSPPITPFHLEHFPAQQAQRLFQSRPTAMHEPPQSAPPQRTSFFQDSPPMQNTGLSHLSWQLPAEVPSNAFQSQCPVVVTQPQYNPLTGQFEQHQIPVAYPQQPLQLHIPSYGSPQQILQGSPDHLYTAQAQYPFQLCQPTPLGSFPPNMFESPAAPQPLEIKVELGPSPQGTPQPRKQYTFANSTPDDFSSPKEST